MSAGYEYHGKRGSDDDTGPVDSELARGPASPVMLTDSLGNATGIPVSIMRCHGM